MRNIPNKIYIQVGEEATKDDDFNKLKLSGDVTYCTDRINKNDLVYYKSKSQEINWDEVEKEFSDEWIEGKFSQVNTALEVRDKIFARIKSLINP